ncbi:hypothetical protein N8I71_08000 [Roseibacterium sp. SDUM158016]|uniref:hypothetical protein n=1 Tax=Roseicyclus sediminis TaxID=2980997 RepID=UPI0021CED910|nr:hypothetical protein [Roseibacterium sp. SDUM158016]MCU4652771.1 hypothetical protein [Roseibacterium sp. SDUM158016]
MSDLIKTRLCRFVALRELLTGASRPEGPRRLPGSPRLRRDIGLPEDLPPRPPQVFHPHPPLPVGRI